MGNCCGLARKSNPTEFFAKQNVSLFYPENDTINSELCDKAWQFSLLDDTDPNWWKMKTASAEKEIVGTAYRLHFYDIHSDKEEDCFPWYFGDISRTECEELLANSANAEGAFLVRFSSSKKELVLSVKSYNEIINEYGFKHFTISKKIEDNPKDCEDVQYYLTKDHKFSKLSDLISFLLEDAGPVLAGCSPLSSICLIPNPISDWTFLRTWELETKADNWMIPRDELELGKELGHGFFGEVNKAVWRGELEVAVKSLRHKEGKVEKDFEKERNTFIKETEVMKKLNHPNLVKMLGVCIEKSPFYLVQELCQNGDLKNHLKSFEFIKTYPVSYLHNRRNKDKLKFENVPKLNTLMSWCQDILKGMCYLESINLVHRDLAARNVLLDSHLRAKVADFGLTMKNDTVEEKENPAMAVLWSAPEAIEKKEFSTKSDVWSFGITMWEVLSYADKPYSGLKKDKVKEKLKTTNYMMEPPKNYLRQSKSTWEAVFLLMKECWHKNPKHRPKFKGLVKDLDTLISEKGSPSKAKKREAWSGGIPEGRTIDSLSPARKKHVQDYDVSTTTSFYDYEINKYDNNN